MGNMTAREAIRLTAAYSGKSPTERVKITADLFCAALAQLPEEQRVGWLCYLLEDKSEEVLIALRDAIDKRLGGRESVGG